MKQTIKSGNLNMAKTVLITGGSSGIGLELSKLFAKDGYDIVLVARDEKNLKAAAEKLREKFGAAVRCIAKDLSSKDSPYEIFKELQENSIHIEALANCAGFNVYGKVSNTDMKKELDMIQTNLVALTHLTKLFLPEMIKRGYGKILNVGSTGSFQPVPLNAIYCATKAYVLNFSEGIAEDLKGTGVTVTALCPGPTRTNFEKNAGMENVRLFRYGVMDAEKVARAGYRAMMRGSRLVIPGIFNKILIFSTRFAPRKAVLQIGTFLMKRQA